MSQSGDQDSPSFDQEVTPTTRDRARELLSDRRALAVIGAALVAVIVLAAFVVVPALTKSSSDNSASGAVQRGRPAATATPNPSVSAAPVNSGGGLAARDPFNPLVVPAAATGAPAAPVTTPPAAGTAPTPGSMTTGQGSVVMLISFNASAHSAVVTVNGKAYNATEGKAFTKDLTLLKVGADSCTFSHDSQVFSLIPGGYAAFA